MPDEWVYVVVMSGNYDRGICGVFQRIPEAYSHAWDLWENSDEYHTFRIEQIKPNAPLWDLPLGNLAEKRNNKRMSPIEFVPWERPDRTKRPEGGTDAG